MSLSVTIISGVVLTVLSCVFGTLFLIARKTENHWHSLWLKALGSIAFVAAAIIMAVYSHASDGWIIVTGLVFGLLGDLLLGFRTIYTKHRKYFFYSGGLAFSIGHIFYIIALSRRPGSFTIITLAVFVLLMAAAIIYAWNRQSRKASSMISGAVYIGFVAVVASMAFSAALTGKTAADCLFALGGISFFLSDNFLGAYSFGTNNDESRKRRLNIILHVTYYLAQLAIGWSILFI